MANVAEIASNLVSHGLKPETPVAVINMGTRPTQHTLISNLGELPTCIANSSIKGATLFVIGEVVTLADELAWFTEAPINQQ